MDQHQQQPLDLGPGNERAPSAPPVYTSFSLSSLPPQRTSSPESPVPLHNIPTPIQPPPPVYIPSTEPWNIYDHDPPLEDTPPPTYNDVRRADGHKDEEHQTSTSRQRGNPLNYNAKRYFPCVFIIAAVGVVIILVSSLVAVHENRKEVRGGGRGNLDRFPAVTYPPLDLSRPTDTARAVDPCEEKGCPVDLPLEETLECWRRYFKCPVKPIALGDDH